jgi:ribulose 1,5-bisphosphate synthetase/thiazole synthase
MKRRFTGFRWNWWNEKPQNEPLFPTKIIHENRYIERKTIFYQKTRESMKNYQMPSQTLPCNDDYEVIVIGGGPAGCTAAAAAARRGTKTLLIEATTALGGMGTMGLVPNWCPFTNRETIVYSGLAQTIFERSKLGLPHVASDAMDWVAINPEHLKRVLDQLMMEMGVSVLFQSTLASVVKKDERTIDAIILASKTGLTAYQAKVYVDTTGDADLIAFANGKFDLGDEEGEIQSQTLCFILSNVNAEEYAKGPWLNRANKSSPAYMIRDSDKYPMVTDPHMCSKLIGHGTVGFNAGHVPITDVTDPVSLSKAYANGREIAHQLNMGLREFHPNAFGNSFLASTATLLGVRESRRIHGDYTLTLEDYAERRTFHDEICRNNYFLDLHPVNQPGQPERIKTELRIPVRPYQKGESHGIPYRCLIPSSFDNVLVAGRSIAVERVVQGSIRVMPSAMAMGEAAGIAASMATEKNGQVRAVDVNQLRNELIIAGAYIK